MAFYDLSKDERLATVAKIHHELLTDLQTPSDKDFSNYYSDEDTYIRKSAYLATGKLYFEEQNLQTEILSTLKRLLHHSDFKVRQTVINAAGEIGKKSFESVQYFFDQGLFDEHHSPRNAVIGSIKKMGEVNPEPVLAWGRNYLNHEDAEVRREICHGIELRGRKHPADILPLLRTLEFDPHKRVSSTLVHVIGQIAYKKGCLETVLTALQTWRNQQLVQESLLEIITIHERYKNFSFYTQAEAIEIIGKYFN